MSMRKFTVILGCQLVRCAICIFRVLYFCVYFLGTKLNSVEIIFELKNKWFLGIRFYKKFWSRIMNINDSSPFILVSLSGKSTLFELI